MGANIFTCRTPHPPGVGSIGQNSTFSEQCPVAYQIKWTHKCSNMVANILPEEPHLALWWAKDTTALEHGHVAYQINGITNAATCKHIYCPYTHPRPLGWSQRSKHFFFF